MAERRKVKILELGFGLGPHPWFLMKEGFSDVSGIEISSSAREKFRMRLEHENMMIDDFEDRFKIGDIRNIPFADGAFDLILDVAAVVCVTYTEHKKVYREVSRLLKPGGKFYTWHLLKDSWGYDASKIIDRDTISDANEGPYKDKGTAYYADYDDLVEIMDEAGLEVVSRETLRRSYENRTKFLNHAILVTKKR